MLSSCVAQKRCKVGLRLLGHDCAAAKGESLFRWPMQVTEATAQKGRCSCIQAHAQSFTAAHAGHLLSWPRNSTSAGRWGRHRVCPCTVISVRAACSLPPAQPLFCAAARAGHCGRQRVCAREWYPPGRHAQEPRHVSRLLSSAVFAGLSCRACWAVQRRAQEPRHVRRLCCQLCVALLQVASAC